MTTIDALEQARARLAELRGSVEAPPTRRDDQLIERTNQYEINEINEKSTPHSSDRLWLARAEEAIDLEHTRAATAESLVSLRETKYRVLTDAPYDQPSDAMLLASMRAAAAVLAQQTEALGWLIKVFRGEPVDRDRLANLTLCEAWRLERHAVFERVWRTIDEESRERNPEPVVGDQNGTR